MNKRSIYLDYAASTPMEKEVLNAMKPYFLEKFYNPSASYLLSKSSRNDLEQARSGIAKYLGVRQSEIIFTAGVTEANNLVVKGIAEKYPNGEILVSAIEHDSVIVPAKQVGGIIVPVTHEGLVDLAQLKKLINENTVLVSIGMVNNEIGVLQPLKEIHQLIEAERAVRMHKNNNLPIHLHTDAAQAGNFFDLHVSRIGVDMLSLNGGKLYGPKQSAILYKKSAIKLSPQIIGGGQEFGLRSGTENVPYAIGLAKALDVAQKDRRREYDRVAGLRELFINELKKQIPQALLNGSKKHYSPHIVSVTLPDYDNERMVMELDELGIQCAVGSACSASDQEPSHVLKAIDLTDKQTGSTIRFSFGRQTSAEDLRFTVNSLALILANNR